MELLLSLGGVRWTIEEIQQSLYRGVAMSKGADMKGKPICKHLQVEQNWRLRLVFEVCVM